MKNKRHLVSFVIGTTMALIGASSLFIYYNQSSQYLMDSAARQSTEAANGDVVQLVANLLHEELRDLIAVYEDVQPLEDWSGFSTLNEFSAFDQQARRLAMGTRILKIKAYARDGTTIYSTDLTQLGDDYSEREDVIHALRGRPSSAITRRDFFISFTQDIQDATIVSSYHGIPDTTGRIIGVMEVYADRTNEFKNLDQEFNIYKGYQLLLLVGVAFAAIGPWVLLTFGKPEQQDAV